MCGIVCSKKLVKFFTPFSDFFNFWFYLMIQFPNRLQCCSKILFHRSSINRCRISTQTLRKSTRRGIFPPMRFPKVLNGTRPPIEFKWRPKKKHPECSIGILCPSSVVSYELGLRFPFLKIWVRILYPSSVVSHELGLLRLFRRLFIRSTIHGVAQNRFKKICILAAEEGSK